MLSAGNITKRNVSSKKTTVNLHAHHTPKSSKTTISFKTPSLSSIDMKCGNATPVFKKFVGSSSVRGISTPVCQELNGCSRYEAHLEALENRLLNRSRTETPNIVVCTPSPGLAHRPLTSDIAKISRYSARRDLSSASSTPSRIPCLLLSQKSPVNSCYARRDLSSTPPTPSRISQQSLVSGIYNRSLTQLSTRIPVPTSALRKIAGYNSFEEDVTKNAMETSVNENVFANQLSTSPLNSVSSCFQTAVERRSTQQLSPIQRTNNSSLDYQTTPVARPRNERQAMESSFVSHKVDVDTSTNNSSRDYQKSPVARPRTECQAMESIFTSNKDVTKNAMATSVNENVFTNQLSTSPLNSVSSSFQTAVEQKSAQQLLFIQLTNNSSRDYQTSPVARPRSKRQAMESSFASHKVDIDTSTIDHICGLDGTAKLSKRIDPPKVPLSKCAYAHLKTGGTPRPHLKTEQLAKIKLNNSCTQILQQKTPRRFDLSKILVENVQLSGPAKRYDSYTYNFLKNAPTLRKLQFDDDSEPSTSEGTSLRISCDRSYEHQELEGGQQDETKLVVIDDEDEENNEGRNLLESAQNLNTSGHHPAASKKPSNTWVASFMGESGSPITFSALGTPRSGLFAIPKNSSVFSLRTPGLEQGGNEDLGERAGCSDFDCSSSPIHLVAATNKEKQTAVLVKRKLIRPEEPPPGTRRSARNRMAPIRYWLGEKPIYRYDSRGNRELVGASDVEIKDPTFVKYKTTSMNDIVDKKSKERKQHARANRLRRSAKRRCRQNCHGTSASKNSAESNSDN